MNSSSTWSSGVVNVLFVVLTIEASLFLASGFSSGSNIKNRVLLNAAGHDSLTFSRSILSGPTTTGLYAQYGPREKLPKMDDSDFYANQEQWEIDDVKRVAEQKVKFNSLLEEMLKALDGDKPEQQLASICSNYVETLLNMRGYEGVELLQSALKGASKGGDATTMKKVSISCDYIMTFLDEFVNQAKSMDDEYKMLLGKIIKAASPSGSSSSALDREEDLDKVLEEESGNFSPGFLRHMENECSRIETAQVISPESAKLLQTLRLVQTRIIDELGRDLGEAAEVLNQLLGYDDPGERIAVLEAGLQVQGIDFAQDMLDMVNEAVEGFKNLPDGEVDPELIQRVTEIASSVEKFVSNSDDDYGTFE